MQRIICIQIPEKIKEMFQHEKYLLEAIKSKEFREKAIEQALIDNNVITALREINSVTSFSSYGFVEKEGFYKEFPEWLNFVLEQLMNSRKINTSTSLERRDMYSSLYNSQEQLNNSEIFDKQMLIEKAEYFTHKSKDGVNYNPKIKDMCTLFIEIGLGSVIPEHLADTSYEAYKNSKILQKK